jgi:hypothetical protein
MGAATPAGSKEEARKHGQSSPDRAEELVMAFCKTVFREHLSSWRTRRDFAILNRLAPTIMWVNGRRFCGEMKLPKNQTVGPYRPNPSFVRVARYPSNAAKFYNSKRDRGELEAVSHFPTGDRIKCVPTRESASQSAKP